MIIKFLSAILKLLFHLWHFTKSAASGNSLSVFVSIAIKLLQNNGYQHFSWHFYQENMLADSLTSNKLTYAELQKGSPGLYKTSGKILTFPGSNKFSFSKLSFPVAKPVLSEISANNLQINCCVIDEDLIAGKIKSGAKKTRKINTIILHFPDQTRLENQKAATWPVSLPDMFNEPFAFHNFSILLIYKIITSHLTYLIRRQEHALATMSINFFIIVRAKFTEGG